MADNPKPSDGKRIVPEARTGGVSRRFLLGLGVALFAAILLGGTLLGRAVRNDDVGALTSEERADLTSSGEPPRLRHPMLGFSFLHPGPEFFESEDSQKKMLALTSDSSTRFYPYVNVNTGSLLLVTLSRRDQLDPDGFEAMVENVAHMRVQQTASRLGQGVPVVELEKHIDAARGHAAIHVLLGSGTHVRINAWQSSFGTDGDYVVMVVGTSRGDDSLAVVIDSFRIR